MEKERNNPAQGKIIKIRIPAQYGSWDEADPREVEILGEISHEQHIRLQRDLSMEIWEVYEDSLRKRYPTIKF